MRASTMSLHSLGVLCALAAGAWLGSAEAPTKLVSAGYSPALISLCMVAGVFVARWTLPTLMRGTAFLAKDMLARPHLIVWAILAGALWAVANTLTVFAIRDVGLSIAFPLWNTNSLVGIFWAWLLFRELRGGGAATAIRVIGGAIAILAATVMLTYASVQTAGAASGRVVPGVLAAFGASLLWGTMYIPYRKAYLTGLNPLSFVTVFTVGELVTMLILALRASGGPGALGANLQQIRPAIFWLFLGGFCWVIGDLFQHYATKYIGISRAIPLSNTNQFWGLAWGALVFGELSHLSRSGQIQVVLASALMIAGALAISSAVAKSGEAAGSEVAMARESERYGLELEELKDAQRGAGNAARHSGLTIWDSLIVAAGAAIFVALGMVAKRPPLSMDVSWIVALVCALCLLLAAASYVLWRRTKFT